MNGKTAFILRTSPKDWRSKFAQSVDLLNGTSFSIDAQDRRRRRPPRRKHRKPNSQAIKHVIEVETNGRNTTRFEEL